MADIIISNENVKSKDDNAKADVKNKSKISSYIAVGLACSALTFGVSWYTMFFCKRDVIRLGEKMSVVNECKETMKKADYPFSNNDPVKGAISAYVSELASDKFTFYTKPADDVTDMTNYVNSSGTAEASGFQIDVADDGNIILTDITPGLAAYKQGLRAGDVITSINGKSVSKEKYENIANKLLGKQDTKVSLTVMRQGEEFDVEFVRDHIYKRSVEHEIKSGVGILTIKSVNQYSNGEFDQSVRALADCEKIIVDLRNNPGGDGAVAMEWATRLDGSAQVTKYYYTGQKEELSLDGNGDLCEKKVVILTNEYTASAAEILCANLSQNLDATIVGTKTYGKGVFQLYSDLSDGGQLCYVAGYFTVGDLECWNGKGIEPDVEVPMDYSLVRTDGDIQFQKALELLD